MMISRTVDGKGQSCDDAERVHRVLAMEDAALQRWLSGDPSGFLEICADDVVYFDPFTPRRVNGKAELVAYYEPIRGKVRAARYEIVDPQVQECAGIAVLTFNFLSYGGNEDAMRWNCTEVYRLDCGEWRIIQTHWSFCKKP